MVSPVEPPLWMDPVILDQEPDWCASFESLRTSGEINARAIMETPEAG